MTNRREFLQVAAVSGLPAIAGAVEMVGAARARIPLHTDLHAVLIDERYAEARSVGAHFSRAGTQIHTVPYGDVTQIWLHQIAPIWRHQPVAIAGLTTRPALFCLEQLAWSYGLRVVFHGEHIVHPGGRAEHSLLCGAEGVHLSVRDLWYAGPLWPARIADAITTQRQYACRERFGPSVAALEPTLPSGAHLLTSWIIAPV